MSGRIYQFSGHRVDVVDVIDAPAEPQPPIDQQTVESDWDAGNLHAPRPFLAELWASATDDVISAVCFWLSVVLFLAMIFSPQIAEVLQ